MFELKISLICPSCKKVYSEASIFRQDIKSIYNEKFIWDKKLIVLKCGICDSYLEIETNIFNKNNKL